jgi:hypothetical protein
MLQQPLPQQPVGVHGGSRIDDWLTQVRGGRPARAPRHPVLTPGG